MPPKKKIDYSKTLDFLKRYEDFRDTVYYDGNGVPTIGYGFTDPALVSRGRMTKAEADKILYQEVNKREPFLSKLPYWDNLSEDSKTALRSYYYNYPAGFKDSTRFMRYWNAGDYASAVKEVDAGMNDKKNRGLRTRRLAEQALLHQDPFLFKQVDDGVQIPVSTAVRPVIPAENISHTWDGVEDVSPYVTGKPMLKIKQSVPMANLVKELEDSLWKPSFTIPEVEYTYTPMLMQPRSYRDGKLPGYRVGTRFLLPR